MAVAIALLALKLNVSFPVKQRDQGIIALTKRAYRKIMCSVIIEEMDGLIESNKDTNVGNIARKISLLQAMELWRKAWHSITKEAIQNCWNCWKMLFISADIDQITIFSDHITNKMYYKKAYSVRDHQKFDQIADLTL